MEQERILTEQMAVLGGGTMGVGIAYVAAQAGYQVLLVEPDDRRVETVRQIIRDTVASAIGRGKLDDAQGAALIARIARVDAIEALPEGLDLIVESVPERLELKLDDPVQLQLEGVRLKTGLKLLLDQLDLTFQVIPEDNLLIITDAQGSEDRYDRILTEIKSLHREMHDVQDAIDALTKAISLDADLGAQMRKPTIIEEVPEGEEPKTKQEPRQPVTPRPRPGI